MQMRQIVRADGLTLSRDLADLELICPVNNSLMNAMPVPIRMLWLGSHWKRREVTPCAKPLSGSMTRENSSA